MSVKGIKRSREGDVEVDEGVATQVLLRWEPREVAIAVAAVTAQVPAVTAAVR